MLVPLPFAPTRCIGPASIGTARRLRCANGIRDWAVPLKAEIAVSRLDWQARHFGRTDSGSMQVELDRAKTVCPSLQPLDQRGPEHISIEDVGALPVGNMHHAMVERDRNRHSCSLRPHPVIGSVPVVPGNPAVGKNSIR